MACKLILLPVICILIFGGKCSVSYVDFITSFDGHKYKVVTPNVHVMFDAYSIVNISSMQYSNSFKEYMVLF